MVLAGAGFAGTGIALLVNGIRVSGGCIFLICMCLLCLVAIVDSANALAGRTTIDDNGLRMENIFRHRTCRWADIRDIKLRTNRYQNSTLVTRVVVLHTSGRWFALPGVRTTRERDPAFDRRVRQITGRWQAAPGYQSLSSFVPVGVSAVAARHGLGRLVGTTGNLRRAMWRLIMPAGVVLVFFFAILAIRLSAADREPAPAATAGAAALLLAALTSRVPRVRRILLTRGAAKCYVYADGLVFTGWRGGVRASARWADITSLFWSQQQVSWFRRPRPDAPLRVRILLAARPGIAFKVAKPLGRSLLGLHAAAVTPDLKRALLAGHPLLFGPFLLSPSDLAEEARIRPWQEITGYNEQRGLLTILSPPARPRPPTPTRHIPDVLVLEHLIRDLAGRPWPPTTSPPPKPTPTPAGKHKAGEAAVAPGEPPAGEAAADPGGKHPAGETAPSPGGGHAVRSGGRYRLLAFLTPLTVSRGGAALGGGAAFAVACLMWGVTSGAGVSSQLVISILDALIAAPLAYGLVTVLVRRVAWFLASSLAAPRRPRTHRRFRYAAIAVVVAVFAVAAIPGAAIVVAWRTGPNAISDVALTALPVILVFLLAAWAFARTQQRVRNSLRRRLRHLADLPAAILAGTGIMMLFDRSLLVRQPAAIVLFPLGVWASYWAWQALAGSRRLAISAVADLVFSLLLGTDLVLFLVWGANLLGLSEPQVAFLRDALQRAGSVADLPWWAWLGLLGLLAAANLAFALRPAQLKAAIRWSDRLRLNPSAEIGRRLLTGVHIGLLVIVLIGLSGPGSLNSTVKSTYVLALQRELEATGENAAYMEISSAFTAPHSMSPADQTILISLVSEISYLSGPAPGDTNAPSAEDDLAYRVGQLQAAAIDAADPPSVQSTLDSETETAGFGEPAADPGTLDKDLGELSTEEHEEDAAAEHVDHAADLATAAIAAAIQIPGIGSSELVQVLQEYLSGLVEGSRLKDVFAAWAMHLVSSTPQVPADNLVIPDPKRLEAAVQAELAAEQTSKGLTTDESDPSAPSNPAEAAVYLADQSTQLTQGSTTCAQCGPQPALDYDGGQPPPDDQFPAPDDQNPPPDDDVHPADG